MLNTQYPAEWSTMKKLIWLRGTPAGGNPYPVYEVSGSTPLHLVNALPKPLLKNETNILPVQDLHGYSAPWPAGGGKNLFNSAGLNRYEQNGITVTESNGVLTLNGTAQYDAYFVMANLTYSSDTYAISANNASTDSNVHMYVGNSGTYVSDVPLDAANKSGIFTSALTSFGFYVKAGASLTNFAIKPQLEKSSSATSWSPYSNICPIQGWTGATVTADPLYGGEINWNQRIGHRFIESTSSNGITLTNNNNGSYTVDGTATADFDGYSNISVKGGHYYIIRGCPSGGSADTYYLYSAGQKDTGNGARFNAPNDDTRSVDIIVKNGTTVDNMKFYPQMFDLTIMFGAGNEPTLDEFNAMFPNAFYLYNAGTVTNVSAVSNLPYATATIQFGDTYYGGTVDLATGVLTVTYASKDLGTLTWTASSTPHCFYANWLTNRYKMGDIVDALCSAYKYDGLVSASPYYGDNGTFKLYKRGITVSPSEIYIHDDNYSDAVTFKTAMSGVQLVYELDSPQTIQLDPVTLTLLRGENWVWSNCGNQMAVTYATSYPLETLTATGTSPLYLENSQNKKLVQCEVGIVATQEGSGDPYPAGGGVNKYNNDATTWSEGTTVKNDSGEETQSTFSHYTTNYTAVDGSTQYTLSGDVRYSDTQVRIYYYDANKAWIERTSAISDQITFTTPADCRYIQVQTHNGGTVDASNWVLSVGSTAPASFTPYSNIRPITGVSQLDTTVADNSAGTSGTTYSTEFDSVCYGGTYDELTGTLTLTHKKVVYNGSETWTSAGNNREGYYITTNDLPKSINYTTLIMCESMKVFTTHGNQAYKDASYGVTGYYDSNSAYPNRNWIYAKANEIINDATAFKAWLAQNPITVVYEFATPITMHYDPHAIKSLGGHSYIISNGNGTITVQYKGIDPT